jgi:hypothetical protein
VVLSVLPESAHLEPYLPRFVVLAVAGIKAAVYGFWERLSDPLSTVSTQVLQIDNLLWTALLATTMCMAVELSLRGHSLIPSPFDQVAESPQRFRWFVWLVLAFTVLCLAALPTLIVAGQSLFHLRIMADQMARFGWPS